MQITFKQSIAWAHRGVEIVHYAAGQTIATDDADLAAVALREGWAQASGSAAPAPAASASAAPPESASASAAPAASSEPASAASAAPPPRAPRKRTSA